MLKKGNSLSRGKKRVLRALLVVASFGAAIGIIEWYLGTRINSFYHIVMPASDPMRRYDLRPNSWCRTGGIVMHVDGLGRRFLPPSPSFPSQTTTNPLDVLFVGDSFMFGMSVPDTSSVPYFFREIAHKAGVATRAMNGGVFGYGLMDEYSSLQRWSAEQRPDLVIWQIYANDLDASIRLRPGDKDLSDALYAHSYLIRLLYEKFPGLRGSGHMGIKGSNDEVLTLDDADSIFRAAAAWSRSESIPVLLYATPGILARDIASENRYREFEAIAVRAGLRWLPVLPILHAEFDTSWTASDRMHLSAHGNQRIAETLFDLLRQDTALVSFDHRNVP